MSGNAAAILISMYNSNFGSRNSLPGRAVVFSRLCDSMTGMDTTTFQYSVDTLAHLDLKHESEHFINREESELAYVNEEDDTGEDRLVYGWGDVCPVPLIAGVDVCRSFKQKHNCCSSVVSEPIARNYLAKHIFDSSNHPTHGDKKASLKAANDEPIVCTTETSEDRKTHRNHSGNAIRLRAES